jgi:hypothetical protein
LIIKGRLKKIEEKKCRIHIFCWQDWFCWNHGVFELSHCPPQDRVEIEISSTIASDIVWMWNSYTRSVPVYKSMNPLLNDRRITIHLPHNERRPPRRLNLSQNPKGARCKRHLREIALAWSRTTCSTYDYSSSPRPILVQDKANTPNCFPREQ